MTSQSTSPADNAELVRIGFQAFNLRRKLLTNAAEFLRHGRNCVGQRHDAAASRGLILNVAGISESLPRSVPG